jgi:hypothetical protein
VCRIFSCQRSDGGLPPSSKEPLPQHSLSNLVTSGTAGAPLAASLRAYALRRPGSAKRSVPTSVQEKPEGLITPPKLFQISNLSKTPRRRDRSYIDENFLNSLHSPLAARVGLPTVARSSSLTAHLRASRYGEQPSPALMSEGWWRIPGSNR